MTTLYETFVGEKIAEHKVGGRFFRGFPFDDVPGSKRS